MPKFICLYAGNPAFHPSQAPEPEFAETAEKACDKMAENWGAGILVNCVVRPATPEELAEREEALSNFRL